MSIVEGCIILHISIWYTGYLQLITFSYQTSTLNPPNVSWKNRGGSGSSCQSLDRRDGSSSKDFFKSSKASCHFCSSSFATLRRAKAFTYLIVPCRKKKSAPKNEAHDDWGRLGWFVFPRWPSRHVSHYQCRNLGLLQRTYISLQAKWTWIKPRSMFRHQKSASCQANCSPWYVGSSLIAWEQSLTTSSQRSSRWRHAALLQCRTARSSRVETKEAGVFRYPPRN